MNKNSRFVFVLVLLTLPAVAQEQKASPTDARTETKPPAIVERGPHHRVWQRTTTEVLPNGRTVERKHSYTELGVGMNRLDPATGQWVESKEEIELFKDGGVARQGQHSVIFGQNINSAGVIDLLTPEGKRLRSHILGLAFTDAASGNSTLIAEPKDSVGELLAPNKVIYRDAFDGPVRADVVFLYTISGFEQFVILTEAPPSPAEYGLSPDSTLLEVWTEFLDAPEPVKRLTFLRQESDPVKRQAMVAPDFTDEFLGFGAMSMPLGTAFPMEGNRLGEIEKDATPTGKSWLKLDGRTFLVEKVEYGSVKNELDRLPQAAAAARLKKPNVMMAAKGGDIRRPFPRGPKQVAALDRKPLQMASLSLPSKGFVLDYALVAAATNFTFRGDTTYWVSNKSSAFNGTTVIEGGAVVKFSAAPNLNRLQILGPIDCRTSPWHPAFFVAKDDNTVGEIIAGSTGSPGANTYAGPAIHLSAIGQTNFLHDLRFRNTDRGIWLSASESALILEHTQFRNANYPIYTTFPVEGRNLLIESCTNAFLLSTWATARLEHVTFHLVKNFNGSTNKVLLKNSLLISVTNSVAFSGSNNATNLSDSGIFQTVGSGAHYLAANSTNRNAGTMDINPTLLAALKSRTTFPPSVLANNITANTTLSETAWRDTDTPDLGYHYDPMDFVANNIAISGATVTISPGTVVGTRGTGFGLRLLDGAGIIAEGTPLNFCRFVRYNLSQEQANTNWSAPTIGQSIYTWAGDAPSWQARFRFTEWNMPAAGAGAYHFYGDGATFSGAPRLIIQDSIVRGGAVWAVAPELAVTNCLFQRVDVLVYSWASDARNCTFIGGNFSVDGTFAGPHEVADCLFDRTYLDPGWFGTFNHHNAYVTNQTRLDPLYGNDLILTNTAYEIDKLGRRFYLEATSPLIDAGSTNADSVGLYHYTTTTNQVKEGTSTNNIGFHYVALSETNQPVDTDNDGFADYSEDENGNGTHETGERRWRNAPTLPVIAFSSNPLDYFPNAGLVLLDGSVTVTDNDPFDQNFVTLTNLTIVTAPGDFVRLLTDSVYSFQPGGGVLRNLGGGAALFAIMKGGDGSVPLIFDFRVPGRNGASVLEVQELLRALKFTTDAAEAGHGGSRTVRAIVQDTLGASSSASRAIQVLVQRPRLVVDAGPDISILDTQLGNQLIIPGTITAAVGSDRVSVEWTLVEPVWWDAYTRLHCSPLEYVNLSSAPYIQSDLLHEVTGENPRFSTDLAPGVPVTAELRIPDSTRQPPIPSLPTLSENKFGLVVYGPILGVCDWIPEFIGAEAYQPTRYRFRLTARDGYNTVMDEVVIRIFAANGNEAPEINFRPTSAVKPLHPVTLAADVLDEHPLTLTYHWEVSAAQTLASGANWTFSAQDGIFVSTNASPEIKFHQTGRYLVVLRVTDDQNNTTSKEMYVKVCDLPRAPADIMLVADNSSSMWGQSLSDLKSAGLTLVQSADPAIHQLGLVSFSVTASFEQPLTRYGERLVPALEQIKHDRNVDQGFTYALPALQLAAEELLVSSRRNSVAKPVIVFITDGVLGDQEKVRQLTRQLRSHGVRLITILASQPYHGVDLSPRDIISYETLAQRLRSPAIDDPARLVSADLWSRFSPSGQQQIISHQSNGNIVSLGLVLADELNQILRAGNSIYARARFEDVGLRLRPETQKLFQQNPQGSDLLLLNRLLLEDAYGLYPMMAPAINKTPAVAALFLREIATTESDSYAARSSGLASILDDVVGSICSDDREPPIVELGSDKMIAVGQQLALRPVVKTSGTEAGLQYTWSQASLTQSGSPAELVLDGANDPEAILRNFPEVGDYAIRVTVTDPSGLTGRDEVIVRVSNAEQKYTALIAGYEFAPFSGTVVQCGYAPGSFTPTEWVPLEYHPPVNPPGATNSVSFCQLWPQFCSVIIHCKPSVSGEHQECYYEFSHDFYLNFPYPPFDQNRLWGLPQWNPSGYYTGGYYTGGHYVPGPYGCTGIAGTGGGQGMQLSAIHTRTVVYSIGPNGQPKVESTRWGPPISTFTSPNPLQLPHQCFTNGMPELLIRTLFEFPRFTGFPVKTTNACESCANWVLLENLDLLPDVQALRARQQAGEEFAEGSTLYFLSTFLDPEQIPWLLDAGPDQAVPLSGAYADVQLQGRVTNRKSPGVPYSVNWSLVSGPDDGTMVFPAGSSATSQATTARFDKAGSYLVKLTITGVNPCPPDNTFTTNAFVTIRVGQSTVDAGPDQVVDWLPDPNLDVVFATLYGTFTGEPGTPMWTEVEWPQEFVPPFIPNFSSWQPGVELSGPGLYRISLDTPVGGNDTVLIQVNAAPTVSIWSPGLTDPNQYTPPITQLGLQLIASASDDNLPLGSVLTYKWECVTVPSGGNCFIENPRGEGTKVRFSKSGDYTVMVTVSDGRLSSFATKNINVTVNPNDGPVLAFGVPRNSRGNALELFPPGSAWEPLGLRVSQILSHSLTRLADNNAETPLTDPAMFGVGELELSGTVLRYTPRIPISSCEKGREEFNLKLLDQYGEEHAGKIVIYIVPPPPSKIDYEQDHNLKYLVQTARLANHEWNLRELLRQCPYSAVNKEISGPWRVNTRLGHFERLGDILYFNTPNAQTPYVGPAERIVLTYQMEGAPGAGNLEFILVPEGQTLSPEEIGGVSQVSPVEVGNPVRISTFQPPDQNTYTFTWEIHRDGTLLTSPVPVFSPSGPHSEAQITFTETGTYTVTVTVTASSQNAATYTSTIVVVPQGTLPDHVAVVGRTDGTFDEPEEPETGLTPAELLTKPGRAVIVNLPDPVPGIAPFEVRDGYLVMRGQAAGPTDPDPADGIIPDSLEASYKAFLYPADRGEEVPFDQDDSAFAFDLTPNLTFTAPRVLNLFNGWNRQVVLGTPGNDELGRVDLSNYTNGNYFVQIWARGWIEVNGQAQETAIGKSRKYPILLNTQRKPGKVNFAETDYTVPLAGGRIRISRSYDSEVTVASDAGYGWSLSLLDIGVQLYERRIEVEDDWYNHFDGPDSGEPQTFSIRAAGPHHVTLNLPWTGERVTFSQSSRNGFPVWSTPKDVGGRLEVSEYEGQAFHALATRPPPNGFVTLSQQERSVSQFDFSGFTLVGPDGSKYFLTRGAPQQAFFSAWADDPALGLVYPMNPELTRVEFADGPVLLREITGSQELLKLYPTPTATTPVTLTVTRESGKIIRVECSEPPAGSTDTRPVVKYFYNQVGDANGQGGYLAAGDNRLGNLKEVWRLARTTAGDNTDYDVTKYFYKDSASPQLITKVINPLGLVSFEAVWNGNRLEMTRDAAGIERSVEYQAGDILPAPDGRPFSDRTIVRTPYGNVPLEQYNPATAPKVKTDTKSDTYGNVIRTDITIQGTLPSEWPTANVTNLSYFDETRLTNSTDAAYRTTRLFYDARGRLEETRKPGGVSIRTGYDETGQLSSLADPRHNVSGSSYRDGRLEQTEDAEGNTTTYQYDEDGRTAYVEDALGNRTHSVYYKTGDADLGDNPVGSLKSSYLEEKKLDGTYVELNRTTSTYYKNGLLKTTTAARTGRDVSGASVTYTIKTEYKYDAQGRVTETIQYPSDNPFTESVNESTKLHVSKQTYNRIGKVAVSTDKYLRDTRFYYDHRGNLVQTLYPDNAITRTVYDVNNRPIYQQSAHAGPGGSAFHNTTTTTFGTHTVYDAFGRSVKTEKLNSISIKLVQVTDVNGAVIADMYKGEFVASAAVVLESSTTEYDAIGRVLKVTDAAGNYRRFAYYDAGDVIEGIPVDRTMKRSFVGGPSVIELSIADDEYDASGNVLFSRTFDNDVLASLTSFEYDALNRQTMQRIHNLDAEFTIYSETKSSYDELGRRVQTMDADGKVADFAYDAAGRLRSVTEWLVDVASGIAQPIKTEYSYDEVGNVTVQKDALGRETKYEYDNFGRRVRRTLPGGQSETLAYDTVSLSQLLDGSGNLVQRDFRTDFNTQTTRRDYDIRGRLSWRGSGDGGTTLATFTYTAWGARQVMTDPSGTTAYLYGRVGSYSGNPVPGTFTYDSDQLIVRQRVNSGTPASTDAFLYEHDSSGNLKRVNTKYTFTISGNAVTGVSSPNSSRTDVRYEYDWRNRLSTVRQGSDNTELASYTYSDPGVLKQTTYAVPGLHHTYSYNSANQLLNAIIDRNGTQLRKFDYNPAGYELALSGQRRAAWEYGAVGVLRRQVNYTQDGLSRLVSEDIVTDNTGSTASGKVDYVYDKVGNRLSRQSVNGSSALLLKIPNFSLPTGLTHDANDRLPAPEVYDANGNTLKGDLDGLAGVEQTLNDIYDLEDRLTTSARTGKTVTLAYDGDGNRTRKDVTVSGTVTTTRYVVDDRTPSGYAQVVEEWQSVNGGAWSLARRYTYGLSRIRQERLSGGAVVGAEYYGYDGHGSVALLVDGATGAEGNTYSYDAYGVLVSQGGNTPNHYQYVGEQWDADLGMYYLRARYLNPQSGRFWTMDTFEGNSAAPLSLHKYLYCGGNPVNHVDPSGHEFTILALSVSTSVSQGLQAIYNGVVSAVGTAAQATIFGAEAGKSANEILMDFVLDETGISLVSDAFSYLRDRLTGGGYDEEEAALVAYQSWQEQVIAAIVLSIPEEQYGEFEIEFEPQCFVAGTPVASESGLTCIEEVKPGDRVWAFDEQTGQSTLRLVLNRFVHRRTEVFRIAFGAENFEVTGEHPFFIYGKGWTPANRVEARDRFITAVGDTVPVESVERLLGDFLVYNFEVETDHNYYVGVDGVLTHNASAAALRRALKIADKPLLAAHHIVARFAEGAAAAQAFLKEVGISLDAVHNGVALPKNLMVKRPKGFAKATAHSIVHTKKYYEKVTEELKAVAGNRQLTIEVLEGIGERLRLGTFPIK